MNKYQTPNNDIISGHTWQSAIAMLRQERGHLDSYYDFCYNWRLHDDGIHLVAVK